MDEDKKEESANSKNRLILDRLEKNIRKSEEEWEDLDEAYSPERGRSMESRIDCKLHSTEQITEIKEEYISDSEPEIICINSSDSDLADHTFKVSGEDDDLCKPNRHKCHICNQSFYTKSMLKRHLELHDKNTIYVAGQSVIPVNWIGRQCVGKRMTKSQIKNPERKKLLPDYTSFSSDDSEKSISVTSSLRKRVKPMKQKGYDGNQTKPKRARKYIIPKTATRNVDEESTPPILSDDSAKSTPPNSPGELEFSQLPRQQIFQEAIEEKPDNYDGDKRLPVLVRECKGIKTKEALNFIINKINFERATIVPTDIRENVSFLIDTKSIGSWKNLLSDDMGAWKTTCVANRFYKWDNNGDLITIPNRQPGCLVVFRHQYVNLSSTDLHRIIIRAGFSLEKMMDAVFVQYYFDDKEHAVPVKPHGNRKKDNKPYKRTQETVKNTIKELNVNKRPKDVFHTILESSGGIEQISSSSQKPRDMQQVYNLKRKESKDEILEVIDMQATEEVKFIRQVEMAPEFAVFLATDNQLKDIEKYCTNNANFCILGIDTTFNVGNYYVTLTTYRNLTIEHKNKKHEPVMIGPALVHQRRTFDSFFMLPSYMIRDKSTLSNILVFGTDGEVNLSTAFSSCFPFAHHLLCDIHMKDNIISKLTSLNIKGTDRQLFIDEIFGKQIQENIIPGLVDCLTPSAYDGKLEQLTPTWIERHENGHNFLNYFMEYKSELIKTCMSAELRSKCGLGFPAKPYTQNANECINRVVKSNLDCQKNSVPEFIRALKRTILRQETEIKLALTGQSDFKPKKEYSYLEVSEDRYFRMDLKQKEHVYRRLQNATIKPRHQVQEIRDETESTVTGHCRLTMTADETGITSVPYPILRNIFEKGASLFHSKSDIVPLPGLTGASNVAGKFFVTSTTDANKPHLVTAFHTGQVTCDCSCPRWEMYKICSHSTAVSEHCNILKRFVEWYKSKTTIPNFTGLANMNMPCGRGKKPHKATQVRKGGTNKKNETALNYVHEDQRRQVPLPKPPDGGYILYFLKDCDSKVSKCYGCRGNLKHEERIPPPPRDLIVVTRARREYIKDGVKTYGDISNIYFHLSEHCIKAHNSYFVPSLVYVAPYVVGQFQQKHRDFLEQCHITYT